MKKQDAGMNLRSHSLDKLRQIVTTGALTPDSRPQYRTSSYHDHVFSRSSIFPQPNLPARIFLLRLLTADDRATERVQDERTADCG